LANEVILEGSIFSFTNIFFLQKIAISEDFSTPPKMEPEMGF